MGDCKVEVEPGVCKMHTVIVAKPTEDMMGVTFEVQSDCAHVQNYADQLGTINPYEVLNTPFGETPFVKNASGVIPHAACPCVCAFIKAMEVASGMGLKRDVHFTITDA
ncbi:hypothetical protein TALC_00945 [Thermoplasmatales archaeon BRNA1]|nr:hypothetical protein TALC_00945 [Thermoplasmatales archaeon BRNA1]